MKWAWAAGAGAALVAAACEPSATTQLSGTGVARLELTPGSVAIPPAGSADFVATALTAAGDTADVTVTWMATGGSVTDAGQDRGRHRGHYRAGMFCGDYQVIATARPGNRSDTASVTVTCPVPVVTVEVTPATASLVVGGAVQLTATLRDSSGAVVTGRVITWSSDAPAIAAVDPSGMVTALAAGSATITATREGASATAAVTVSPQGTAHREQGAGELPDGKRTPVANR